MPFQLNQAAGLPAPAADNPCQCGQQQVVDLGAIGRRGHLQQLAGQLVIELEFEGATVTAVQSGLGPVLGQCAGGTGQLLLPQRKLIHTGLCGV